MPIVLTYIVDVILILHLDMASIFCLGAPLARLEAKIVLTELIKRYKSFSFIDQDLPVPISNSSSIYGLHSFPVKVN